MVRTILVVDDEPTLRETLAEALDAEPVRVERFGEGLPQGRFVVDDKDRADHVHPRIRSRVNGRFSRHGTRGFRVPWILTRQACPRRAPGGPAFAHYQVPPSIRRAAASRSGR